ncbi:TVP38/TMEM64 family protein [Pontibacillus yanchengensis]|uniref:TVP38/TMEM64 family protein n=2 Tax=Pontibacillus yanchengensis TaxID=462910 RepID=A0ACC7VM17_9BACI|nr:TVP38/TMEM64 family protein [Pontibacillus yanchengensis]MYL35034.1 TVP38/TMEM64 family protein [Pontibacillus yanchengensis]MYL55255.1 TVP38/TMEM64 family protein [Pontibacillus yanchengensis]
MKQWKNWIKPAIVILLFLLAAYIVRFELNIGKEAIKDFILSFGVWGPLIFFLLYALGPIVFFPTSVMSLAAGLVYGVFPGVIYILLGATGAAATGYVMARYFGDSLLKFHTFKWSDQIYEKVQERGFLYVLVLRLIPIMGFDILSYISGIARVKFGSFILASFLGMMPGTFAYAFLGSSIGEGDSSKIAIGIGFFVLLMFITYLLRNRVKRWLGLS